MAGRPNDTTYAILGLLAMRDWAAYELTKEMQRNLRFFWPRAESAVYVELRKLEKAGHAKSRVERQGGRSTTIYAITAAGRRKLQRWLKGDPRRGALLESEGVLRIFAGGSFAPDVRSTERAIGAVERDAFELIDKCYQVGGEFMAGSAEFQDHLRWRVLTHVFAANYALMLAEWSQWADEMVARWDRDDDEQVRGAALAAFKSARRQLDRFTRASEGRFDPTDPADDRA